MLAYVCDFCGKVLSSATNTIDRKENPYFAIINVDFADKEKQYHCCKSCLDNLIKGTSPQIEIENVMKAKKVVNEWPEPVERPFEKR